MVSISDAGEKNMPFNTAESKELFPDKPVVELELYLIRHGQSRSNVLGEDAFSLPVDEREDPVLTEEGERQAELLGNYLSDTKFDAVCSSCLRRAVLTARGILKHYPEGTPLLMHPVFSEARTPSSYRGLPPGELRKIYPYAVIAEEADISEGYIYGCETDEDRDIQKRAAQAIDYLREKYKNGEKVAVVFHAAFLTHMVFYLLGYKGDLPPGVDIDVYNTGITKVTFFREGTNRFGDVVFSYINKAAHLGR